MEKIQNALILLGEKVNQIKVLAVIRKAFQTFMPFTIVGAVASLWTNVICNSTNGLGSIWEPIMSLSFLNPAFSAINFCTIGCISIGIAFFIGYYLGEENGIRPSFAGILAIFSLFIVSPLSTVITADDGTTIATIKGLFENNLGSKGMFTAIIIALLAVTIFSKLSKMDSLKIKMPEQVPPMVSKSFEDLVPAVIALSLIGFLGLTVNLTTNGLYVNELIYALVQRPLMNVGASLPGFLVFATLILLFWSVGIHGESMVTGILNPLTTALLLENMAAVEAGGQATNIINWAFFRTFLCSGGTGICIALTIAIFLVGKREDNRSIAKVAIIPNLFNINEVNMFGLPVVLNPVLLVPFVLAPLTSILLGYFLTYIGFCPVFYLQMPWTTPIFFMGFLSSGGNIMGGITQLIVIAVAVLIYLPFIIAYEKQQNKEAENAENQ